MEQITGHFKKLDAEEWLEGCAGFITAAREAIRRARRGLFSRTYNLIQAEKDIEMAEECIARAIIERDSLLNLDF